MRWKKGLGDATAVTALVAVTAGAWLWLVRGQDDQPVARLDTSASPSAATPAPPASATPSPSSSASTPPGPSGIQLPDPGVIRSLLPEVKPPRHQAAKVDFVVASFNVLGSSHTAGDTGRKGRMAAGPVRARWAGALLGAYDVDVVGLQELQRNQVDPLARSAGGLRVFPGTSGPEPRDSENSIAWNPDRWQLVSSRLVKIPYFGGRLRNMPVVRLRHKATGAQAMFLNVHNPANTSRFGDNARWRERAVDLEVQLVKQLREQTKLPVFVTGDMNDRAAYFCSFVPRSGMRASNGGTVAGGSCTPPADAGIDWILASRDVTFLDHLTYRARPVSQTSDHPLVLSRVRVDARHATGRSRR